MTINRFLRRAATAALVLGVAGSATACDIDELLEVNDRDRVTPATLEDPDVINVVINGAFGDFTEAYSEEYIATSGLFVDELYSTGTFTTRTATDRREQFEPASGNTSDGAYTDLQFARRALKDAAETVAEHPDFGAGSGEFQTLKALEGYTLVALGEGFCSAVPLSNLEGGEFVYGQPLSSAAVLDSAIAKFDAALASGPSNLAAVGKGRALIDRGQYAAAAEAVAGVPMDFVWHIPHSALNTNPIFDFHGNGRYSVSDVEGNTGLPFLTEGAEYTPEGELVTPGDPRSPWWGPIPGFDDQIPMFVTMLYNDGADDIPLASGVEAWLIKAEAELNDGDADYGTALLNELRANVVELMAVLHEWDVDPANTLAPLPIATTFAQGADQLFHERGFWLLLTGHRLGDVRRQIYLPEYAANSDDAVYPWGEYHKGGTYGDDVVFPLDFDEVNNPNFELSMCNVRSASITATP